MLRHEPEVVTVAAHNIATVVVVDKNSGPEMKHKVRFSTFNIATCIQNNAYVIAAYYEHLVTTCLFL